MVDNDQVSASLNRFGHRVSGHGQTGHDAVDFGPRIPGKQAHIVPLGRQPLWSERLQMIADDSKLHSPFLPSLNPFPQI